MYNLPRASERGLDPPELVAHLGQNGQVDDVNVPVGVVLAAAPRLLRGGRVARLGRGGDVVHGKVELVDEQAGQQVGRGGPGVVLRLQHRVREEAHRAARRSELGRRHRGVVALGVVALRLDTLLEHGAHLSPRALLDHAAQLAPVQAEPARHALGKLVVARVTTLDRSERQLALWREKGRDLDLFGGGAKAVLEVKVLGEERLLVEVSAPSRVEALARFGRRVHLLRELATRLELGQLLDLAIRHKVKGVSGE
mmetsp:Transcript_32491/g.55602  ORF Transcript_32491/g.55602 Transcript_32491/m.55602 type:complete len:254 (-) Transcript_32491:167-928(-)